MLINQKINLKLIMKYFDNINNNIFPKEINKEKKNELEDNYLNGKEDNDILLGRRKEMK